jgi:hypothetical protein
VKRNFKLINKRLLTIFVFPIPEVKNKRNQDITDVRRKLKLVKAVIKAEGVGRLKLHEAVIANIFGKVIVEFRNV